MLHRLEALLGLILTLHSWSPGKLCVLPITILFIYFFYHLWKTLEGWIPMLTEHFLPTDLSKATPLARQFCGLRNVSVAALQQRCQLTPMPTTEKGVVMTVVRKEQITVSGG